MARVNVSVPDPMKAEMDSLNGTVNWSHIAQLAFSEVISKRLIPKEQSMEQLVERIRASRGTIMERARGTGFEEGHDFAMTNADYEDFRLIGTLNPAASTLDTLVRAFEHSVHEDVDHERFFGDVPANTIVDERVSGFIEGVQAVWHEIRDRI